MCEHEDHWVILILQAEGTLVYTCEKCPAQWEEPIL